MTAPLQRLLYVSTLKPEAASRLESTVQDILVQSTANNFRDRLTGFLLCDGVGFVQALEGSGEPLRDCFDRIARDERHDYVTLRIWDQIETRQFPRWSMCALTLSEVDDALMRPTDIGYEWRNVEPGALWQQLWSLAHRHARELDAQHADLMARGGRSR